MTGRPAITSWSIGWMAKAGLVPSRLLFTNAVDPLEHKSGCTEIWLRTGPRPNSWAGQMYVMPTIRPNGEDGVLSTYAFI
jgi:hypothetical protein